MFDFLWNLSSFIVALGVLITVHEYGHFWVARRCGVKVLRFSIGFGKPLWRRIGKDGTEYVIAAIPLGGYVRMLDERTDEVPEQELAQAFNRKPVLQRIAVVSAGPLANLLFAVFAFWVMLMIGVPSVKPVVGAITPDSIAAEAGMRADEEIIRVAERRTADWESLNLGLAGRIGETGTLSLTTRSTTTGGEYQYTLSLANWQFNPERQTAAQSLGIELWRPQILPTLSQVAKGSAGETAGLAAGDTLLAFDDTPLTDWADFVAHVQQKPGEPVTLLLERDGARQSLTVVPGEREVADGRLVGYLGVAPSSEPWPDAYRFDMHYGPLESVAKALDRTWHLVVLSISMIGKLITGDVALQHLSGPISIAQGAGVTAGFGVAYFLGFLALISVNLGIINLLPLPVLDGGHLMYFLIELVRGRPVSERAQEVGFRIGSVVLLMLMSVAIFNDIARL